MRYIHADGHMVWVSLQPLAAASRVGRARLRDRPGPGHHGAQAGIGGARLPGAPRPADRAGQPAQPAGRPPSRPRSATPSARCCCTLRPRRLQDLQRHLRPSRRGRAADAARPPPATRAGRPRRRLPDGRRRVLRARPARPARPERDRRHRRGALSERGEGFEVDRLLRRGHAARRGRDRDRGAAHRRPAHVRAQEPAAAARPGARAPTCCCRSCPSAARTSAIHLDEVDRAARRPSPRGWTLPRRSAHRCCRPPRCTTSARSRSPTRSSTSPARSMTRSGLHAPPHR